MKRILSYAVLICVFFFLQTGVFSHLRMGIIAPNLLLICTASIGMIRGKTEGCLVGFFSGILYDALYASYFGLYALILCVIGYMAGYVNRIFYEEDMTLPLVVIGAADAFYGIIVYLLTFLSRGRMDFPYYFLRIILPEMVYTLILAVLLYRMIFYIDRKLNSKGSDDARA